MNMENRKAFIERGRKMVTWSQTKLIKEIFPFHTIITQITVNV